ncbi:MAG TPA: enoyl-CoA hydratase-related protein [Candidatus Dormibacteraeota bacterium]|jgi:enoyl-CoA hydratase/carnithine racemase|nr:enoyl-CoA hydratase-related protein [Candidatus Dormibacteraeota bacterium]
MTVPELENVLVDLQGHRATITLNRPDQRNPLGGGMLLDLLAAFRWAKDEPEVRVVVLTGAGDKAFCAGADLGSFNPEEGEVERHLGRHTFVDLFVLMTELGKPVVGRINGHALAGGLGLAASCDLLVAADNATFGTPEVNVGVWAMMIQAVLMRNLPRKKLLEMLLLGERFDAKEAHRIGLVNRVVTFSELDGAVDELAQKLEKKSPIIMRLGRDSFYRTQDMEFRAALEYLQAQLALVTLTEDTKEGVMAFFEKREPEFKGK